MTAELSLPCKKSGGRARGRLLCFPWLIIDLLKKQARKKKLYPTQKKPSSYESFFDFCFAYETKGVRVGGSALASLR